MRTDSRRLRFLLRVPLLAASLLVAATASTSAQVPASNFEELALKVTPGDTVYITDDIGKHEDEARILELTPVLLAVSVGGLRRDLAESNVNRIRQRVPDSRKNGALIGLLVGAAGSTAGAVAMASPAAALASALLVTFCLPDIALACSCVVTPLERSEIARALAASDQIFLGRVVARDALNVTFDVEAVWKGSVRQRLEYSTGAEPQSNGMVEISSCDFSFRTGARYLVIADRKGRGGNSSTVCGFTHESTGVGEMITLLDELMPRQAPPPGPKAIEMVSTQPPNAAAADERRQ